MFGEGIGIGGGFKAGTWRMVAARLEARRASRAAEEERPTRGCRRSKWREVFTSCQKEGQRESRWHGEEESNVERCEGEARFGRDRVLRVTDV